MKTKAFFETVLKAPLVNQGWSWGAHDARNNRVFFRVHEGSLKPAAGGGQRALLFKRSWNYGSRGAPERKSHIEALRDGAAGYAVVYSTFDAGDRWKTKDFDHRLLLRLGKPFGTGETVFAKVLGRVPVEDVVGQIDSRRSQAEEIVQEATRKIAETDRELLIKARIGQGKFREEVLDLWDRRCAVTGCAVKEVIRASHIKPWSESNHQQRLDPFNGLPLLATLDALFDRRLIAFSPDGEMRVSETLSRSERRLLLPTQRTLIKRPPKRTLEYLRQHHELLK